MDSSFNVNHGSCLIRVLVFSHIIAIRMKVEKFG